MPITVSKPRNATVSAQLGALYRTLQGIDASTAQEFDFSKIEWVCPLLILPLSAYIQTTGSSLVQGECAISDYLRAISFPSGVDSVTEFEKLFQAEKSYIPISVLHRDDVAARERLETMFETTVYKLFDSNVAGMSNAIYYPMTELIANIFDHSKKDTGHIFAQHYPKKHYLDVCIVDRGRGLAKTYEEEKNLTLSDEDAITEAMKGTSAKPSKERGYGVWTSKRIVCEGLGGDFVMVSGSAALISTGGADNLISLPEFHWQGVIIAYRIPKPASPIDTLQYVE